MDMVLVFICFLIIALLLTILSLWWERKYFREKIKGLEKQRDELLITEKQRDGLLTISLILLDNSLPVDHWYLRELLQKSLPGMKMESRIILEHHIKNIEEKTTYDAVQKILYLSTAKLSKDKIQEELWVLQGDMTEHTKKLRDILDEKAKEEAQSEIPF